MKTLFTRLLMVISLVGIQYSVAEEIVSPELVQAETLSIEESNGVKPLTAENLSVWLEGLMPYILEKNDIAGAVLVVVKDGEILFQNGYGTSDVDTGAVVDPEETLFRPGSVSKLFAWTAVMQLVEKGLIDLDVDVNKYLDFNVESFDENPITMRHLMTHTAGFEESVKGLLARHHPGKTLGELLKGWVPNTYYSPGTTPAYSNYGTALAGYIVEQVSGQSFEEYVDQNIFAPLNMKNSTFTQPLPEKLSAKVSKGYLKASLPAEPFEFVNMSPAGGMSATGADMANFMIAHLQGGEFNGNRILQESTASEMHTTEAPLVPPLNSMRLGFYAQDINGHRVITHGGDTSQFHTLMSLMLDQNVGFYLSYNSTGTGAIRNYIFNSFVNRYFPVLEQNDDVEPVSAEMAAEHAQMVAGYYAPSRDAFSSFLALLGLIGQMEVIAHKDNTISLPLFTEPSGALKRFKEVSPFVWQDTNSRERIAAVVENGKVIRVSHDQVSAIVVLEKMPWYRSAAVLMPLLIIAMIVIALTAIQWIVSFGLRKYFHISQTVQADRQKSYRLVRVSCWFMILTLLSWVSIYAVYVGSWGAELIMGTDTRVVVTSLMQWVAISAGIILALYDLKVCIRLKEKLFSKVWLVALLLSFVVIAWVSVLGSLLTFSTNY